MKTHGKHQAVVMPEFDRNVKPIRRSLQLTIKGLPDNASWQECEARSHLIAGVNPGYEPLKRGEGIIVTSPATGDASHAEFTTP